MWLCFDSHGFTNQLYTILSKLGREAAETIVEIIGFEIQIVKLY